MYVLSLAVVVLAVLVLLDLSLTAAVIRRLRVLGEQPPLPDAGGLPVGAEVPAFEVTTADGGVVTREAFSGRRTLVAFYSTGCRGCREQAPGFVAEAGKLAAEGIEVLPVLMANGHGQDEDEQEGKLRELLAGTGRLVVDDQGALPRAFAVQATPSYFVVGPDGRVTGKGLRLAESLGGSPS